MSQAPVIVWFRNDLRLADHPALRAAVEADGPVLAVYVLDEAAAGTWRPGGASRWWLHHSLARLGDSLAAKGCPFVLRRGDTLDIISSLAADVGAETVTGSRAFEPWSRQLEEALSQRLGESGRRLRRFSGTLLHDPDQLLTKSGGPYKVFTPFWRALAATPQREPVKAPPHFKTFEGGVDSEDLEDWELLPRQPDWAGGLRETWTPGQEGARARLEAFLDSAINEYADKRNLPGQTGTSRLSPHLRFGEISPAQIWQAVQAQLARGDARGKGADVFLSEIAWREFSYHLLHHFPSLPVASFREAFEDFPWQEAPADLAAWQRGRTGYPIVDAGMRELWHTGWMHNRVRMIVASFLTKHLLLPWQAGEAWFWDTLVDADLASNAASWQWVAGSGADAAPYFRIFNPVIQGEKFDPDGKYVRKWVPELAEMPDSKLHQPWTASASVLKGAGVELGGNYPAPIVDHKDARERALAAYETIKG
jgi:deoxyribodipyrimidine photo-lyase